MAIRAGALGVLESWRRLSAATQPDIGGRPIGGDTVALVGAVEVAVHGWDISVACGTCRPIPTG